MADNTLMVVEIGSVHYSGFKTVKTKFLTALIFLSFSNFVSQEQGKNYNTGCKHTVFLLSIFFFYWGNSIVNFTAPSRY